MLWIGLHLPLLSLESFAATLPCEEHDQPLALLDAHTIAFANASARRLGVAPGQKRATALALAPQLRIGQADTARDAQALASVAHAALAFTPAVTLSPPQGVMLEVQASLRYFGGQGKLLARLRAALAPLRHRVLIASAPTAQGALLLARCEGNENEQSHCADLASLRRALDNAPVWLLGPGREHWEALQGMGLRSLSDLRHLPRAGLARRFGVAMLDELDRALGERPDPRDWVGLPPAFEGRLELYALADNTEQVLHGALTLLARLIAWAGAQHARVRRFTLEMQHELRHRDADAPRQTKLDIALAEPSRDVVHLQALLRERLARTTLPAPTLELHLHCTDIAHSAPPNSELFPTPKNEHEGLGRLIERLQARLGDAQVQRLTLVADHRPERGSVLQRQHQKTRKLPLPDEQRVGVRGWTPRPVWLLAQPQPLAERAHQPLLDGMPLQLLCGPERIESGWWDGALAERDYFIAQDACGALVWVFRGRLPRAESGWYLQGRFG